MAVYLVTWNLNKEGAAYNAARAAFIKQLETYPNCADGGLETVRFIQTDQTAQTVNDFLRQKMDANDRLFVTKLVAGQRAGWLEQDTWNWLEARH